MKIVGITRHILMALLVVLVFIFAVPILLASLFGWALPGMLSENAPEANVLWILFGVIALLALPDIFVYLIKRVDRGDVE
jgi:hypothetical protein